MRWIWLLTLALAGLAGTPHPAAAQDEAPQVRAVLFYSPACPHCHDVMEDHLPPLLKQHGKALRIVAINVDTPEGQALYRAVVEHFRLPRERLGVPALVVGERILVGSGEIPAQLPGIVKAGLAGKGIDWPPIAELRAFLTLRGMAADPSVELQGWLLAGGGGAGGDAVARLLGDHEGTASSMAERFMSDPAGNAIAVVVLLGMITVLVLSVRLVWRPDRPLAEWPVWVVPVLTTAGVAIALYLAFIEVTGTEAVCGPVGDCNRVQQSPYAAVAGVPIGVLGVVGYLLIGGLWLLGRGHAQAHLLVWGLAAGGVAFSIYLTFLEPFVIGATCMWCINSAIVMTLILMATTPPASHARRSLVRRAPSPAAARRRVTT
ncbi:MAG: vitamin K epoxide reductase family protein [Gemmatimonadota bacterium]